MKFNQSYPRSQFLIMVALLLILTACERPFQDDTVTVEVPSVQQPAAEEDLFNTPAEPETPETGEESVGEGGTTETPAEPAEGEANETDVQPVEGSTEEGGETTDNAPDLQTNEAGERVYVVASGDTVGRIAVLYGVTIEDIAAANPNLVSVDILDVGQALVIPEPGFAASGQAAAPVEEPAEPAEEPAAPAVGSTEEIIHTVRSGETIYSIGLQYGFTVEELQEYNELTNPDVLKIGDEIRIPPASTGE